MVFRGIVSSAGLCFLLSNVAASESSVGTIGINSAVTNLTGANIGIGQIEESRPGQNGFDPPGKRHSFVNPTEIFRLTGSPNLDDADSHGQEVAGVMIASTLGTTDGVAPQAKLYSSATVELATAGNVINATEHVAKRNSGMVYAINHSWGTPPQGLEDLNGSSFLSAGMDWIAAEYDVLNVFAGYEVGNLLLPADSFNGFNVGYSEKKGGYWRKVGEGNTAHTFESRNFVDIIAPGEDVELTDLGTTSTSVPIGTSFAAPHVTGAVALLQQYVTGPINEIGGTHWGNTFQNDNTARRHEVMKAVLINSADKLSGVQGSSRTVESNNDFGNYDWTTSTANINDSIPLDPQFGAGHLNVEKAVTQLENGEWDNGSPVPHIGWDFGETGGFGTPLSYPFEEPLTAGEYIAITLTWDRAVENIGGFFSPQTLNDLDLYLLPKNWTDFNQAVARSVSSAENVEHIFKQVPTSGDYEIVVTQFSGNDQHFGLAWRFGNPSPPITPGDFDADGDVDGDDFMDWQRGNSPDPLSAGDLGDWQANYGTPLVAASQAVPEPAPLSLLAFSFAIALFHRRSVPIT